MNNEQDLTEDEETFAKELNICRLVAMYPAWSKHIVNSARYYTGNNYKKIRHEMILLKEKMSINKIGHD